MATAQIVERPPLITDAVLYLLRIMPMSAKDIAELINRRDYDRFEPLRERWGHLYPPSVYAAMSGLRSKRNKDRCFIEPVDGSPAEDTKYQITTAGRSELLRRITEGKFTLPEKHTETGRTAAEAPKQTNAPKKNRMFDDIPSEHPWLRLDETVRVIDERSIYFGLIGKVDNIRMGDRAYVAVTFDHVPAEIVSRRVGGGGRHSYMSYSPAVELVPLRDEHEELIGEWSFSARFCRHYNTGAIEKIMVTGPTLRRGDALFDNEEFLKESPVDALTGAIHKAFITLVAPKLIQRVTEIEDTVTKLNVKKLDL